MEICNNIVIRLVTCLHIAVNAYYATDPAAPHLAKCVRGHFLMGEAKFKRLYFCYTPEVSRETQYDCLCANALTAFSTF